jgi:Fungal rhodopsin domain
VSKGIRRACWATLAFIGAYGIYCFLTNIFACIPVSAFWSPTGNERCINKKFSWFFNASINILTDLVIMILPMSTLKALKLPTRQKIGLMVIFALGGL